MAICACYYYDLADTIDSMTDKELEEIVANKGIECDLCDED
jgi:redox-regulated HSP33 family molecular chaperone